MKAFTLIISVLFFTSVNLIAGGNDLKTDTFKVYGNCGMCKRIIEKAAAGVDGVKSAVWDMKTDMLTVTYNAKKVDLDQIKAAVAASGYDSDSHRAPDEVYNNLHGCCQYERPKP